MQISLDLKNHFQFIIKVSVILSVEVLVVGWLDFMAQCIRHC